MSPELASVLTWAGAAVGGAVIGTMVAMLVFAWRRRRINRPLAQMAKALGIDMTGKAFTPHAVQEIKTAMYRRCLTMVRAEQDASSREPD